MRSLISGQVEPEPGDLVLATVDELGKHQRIELPNGRRSRIFPGDEVIVCYGNRYAPDQYEALIAPNLATCDFVASGGIASSEICRHDKVREPTRIVPIGLIGDENGQRLNVSRFRIQRAQKLPSIPIVVVAGTSMNAGKTLTAGSLIRSLRMVGFRVAGLKVTGTGSGADLWVMRDMGANVALDFTDAGLSSTYKVLPSELEGVAIDLMYEAEQQNCNIAVVEIADGLGHDETSTLLASDHIRAMSLGVVFAAYDTLGACSGAEVLRRMGHNVLSISGQITRSPLSIREVIRATGQTVHTPSELATGALMPVVSNRLKIARLESLSLRSGGKVDLMFSKSQPADRELMQNGVRQLDISQEILGVADHLDRPN